MAEAPVYLNGVYEAKLFQDAFTFREVTYLSPKYRGYGRQDVDGCIALNREFGSVNSLPPKFNSNCRQWGADQDPKHGVWGIALLAVMLLHSQL